MKSLLPATPEPPISVILGLPFHQMTMDEALKDAMNCIERRENVYFVTPNLDFAAQAYHSNPLRQILFHAKRVLCDGMPIVWLSKLFGGTLENRLTGADFLPKLLEKCDSHQKSVFFIVDTENTLFHLKSSLQGRYPHLSVVGHHVPPQADWQQWDNDHIVSKIQQASPDLLVLGISCPKQEEWIAHFYQKAGVPLSIGVGAGLILLAELRPRAPKILQKIGLEWAWRLMLEPKRLLKRYMRDIYFFFWASLKQYRSLQKEEPAYFKNSTTPVATPQGTSATLCWQGRLERSMISKVPSPECYTNPIQINGQQVTFIDSSGLGLLAKIIREAKKEGQSVTLINPSKSFLQAIEAVQLDREIHVIATPPHAPWKN
jgi:N-acetylglucosaminyldiphosphoundecaprenol N-acetyl-beta-D-mannosaminyltransferase